MDSDFFQKRFLLNIAAIEGYPKGYIRLGDVVKELTGGATPLGADYPQTGIGFLRVQNIMQNYIDDGDLVCISKKDDEALSRSRLIEDDVLLTITGVSYGKSAVVTTEFSGCNINQHSVRIALKADSFSPFFISTFLNSNAGKLQSDQNITGIERPALDYETIRRFRIPKFSDKLQAVVAATVRLGHNQLARMKQGFTETEELLSVALGLQGWQPPEPLTYRSQAAEVFTADRIDAEYYHPAKKAFFARLEALPGRPLEAHYRTVREMFVPAAAKDGEWVRNFDLTDALQPVLDDEQPTMPARQVGSTKKRFSSGDVVISRLRAYLREIALVRTSSVVPSVGSSEFVVLRPHDTANPRLSRSALLMFLRSHPVQTILKWSQDGSHHPRFGEEDLMCIPVPDAVCTVAPKIERLFDEILGARAQARALLAQAQRAVEIAIDESEAAAMKYLKGS